MKIIHNGNNTWQEEFNATGLDKELIPWLDGIMDEAESKGIVRALKWVLFLNTYKSTEATKRECEKFIQEQIKLYPKLKYIESY